MAMNLTAKFKLIDQFSAPMKNVEKKTKSAERAMKSFEKQVKGIEKTGLYRDKNGRLRDAMGRFVKDANRASGAAGGFKRALGSIGGAVGGLMSIKSAFIGIAGAIGGAVAAKKIFDATVLSAGIYQQNAVTIDAMFNDKKLGKQYRDMIEKIAIDSPILDVQEIMGSSKGFIAITKDIKQLERMIKLTELLAAYSPEAGTEGASFALRELIGGDYMSMKERFNMTSKDLQPIADLFKDGQTVKGIKAFEDFLNGKNINSNIVKEQGNTFLGMWSQVRESFSKMMREMGNPALQPLTDFLKKVRDKLQGGELDQFVATGGRIIEKILTGMSSGILKIYEYFAGLSNDPEFQKRTTLFGKLEYIFADFFQAYEKWLDDGGQDKINSAMKNLIQIASAALLASQQLIVETATSIGVAIGKSMASAAKQSMVENFDSWYGDSLIGKLPMAKIPFKVGKFFRDNMGGGASGNTSSSGRIGGYGGPKSHASGLSNVPYNGYQANLHKGERVLTPEENKEYSNGRRSVQFGDIHIHGVGGDLEQAANKIISIMARKIEMEGA